MLKCLLLLFTGVLLLNTQVLSQPQIPVKSFIKEDDGVNSLFYKYSIISSFWLVPVIGIVD
jgi:hypothetical protein